MAASITLLKSTKQDYGVTTHRVLYWYAISPVIEDTLGNTKAPQNRNQIRAGDEILNYLSAQDLDDLDAGTAGYEIRALEQTAGETNVAFRNRALSDHAVRASLWVADRRAEYALTGTTAT